MGLFMVIGTCQMGLFMVVASISTSIMFCIWPGDG